MAEWVKREYGKGAIDRAGKLLIPWWKAPPPLTPETEDEARARNIAFGIVENWRTSHGLPLNAFQAALRGRAQRIEPKVIVAQRLKRFSSVMNKLVREPTMKLSQMHDFLGDAPWNCLVH